MLHHFPYIAATVILWNLRLKHSFDQHFNSSAFHLDVSKSCINDLSTRPYVIPSPSCHVSDFISYYSLYFISDHLTLTIFSFLLLLLEYCRHSLALRHLSWLFYLFNSLYHLLTSTNLQGQIFHFLYVFLKYYLTQQPIFFNYTTHCQSPLYLLFLIFSCNYYLLPFEYFLAYCLLSILHH